MSARHEGPEGPGFVQKRSAYFHSVRFHLFERRCSMTGHFKFCPTGRHLLIYRPQTVPSFNGFVTFLR